MERAMVRHVDGRKFLPGRGMEGGLVDAQEANVNNMPEQTSRLIERRLSKPGQNGIRLFAGLRRLFNAVRFTSC